MTSTLSQDGTTLVQTVQRESYLPNSLQTERDGTFLVQVADTAAGQVRSSVTVPVGEPDRVGVLDVAVSPDGRRVAAVVGTDTDPDVEGADRLLIRFDEALTDERIDRGAGGIRSEDAALSVDDAGSSQVLLSQDDGTLQLIGVAADAAAPGQALAVGRDAGDRTGDDLQALDVTPATDDRVTLLVGRGPSAVPMLRLASPAGARVDTGPGLCATSTVDSSADGRQLAVADECPQAGGGPVVRLFDVR